MTINRRYFLEGRFQVIDLSNANILQDSFQKAIKSAKWKEACQKADHDSLSIISDIQHDLSSGNYKTDEVSNFVISERGKVRVINGNTIKDRTVRHALCDYVLMPAIKDKVIYDNSASQVGKGVDFARRRLKTHLQKYYRRHGNRGYILRIDFSKYYDNILHREAYRQLSELMDDAENKKLLLQIFDSFKVDVSYMTDEEYANRYSAKFDSIQYQTIPRNLKTGEKFMRKSVPIGDQTSQIVGIYYPHRIDNYCKIVKGIKFYGRYMDDIYIIHESKDFLQQTLKEIGDIGLQLGLHINLKKTQIYRIDKPFHFLQNLYFVTSTGRVVEKISKKRLTRMRRKLKKLAYMVNTGDRQISDVENMYRSWMGSYKKVMSKQQIKNMEQLYTDMFGKV